MIGFVLPRVAGLAVTLLLAALLIYVVLDPAAAAADAPVWQRFFGWIGGALLGDFGSSAGGPLGAMIAERLAVTVPLALLALLLAALAGVPLGLLAGSRPGPIAGAAVTGGTLVAAALPAFWVGMLLVLLFSATLRWLPSGGFVPWQQSPPGALGSLVLPALALAVPLVPSLARVMRDATAQTLASGFIRTARLKGMTLSQAFWRHGLRNAALPLLAMLGPLLASLLAGAIVVENVFYLPGLGRLVFTAFAEGDLPTMRGALLALLVAMAAALLVADLLRLWADPRLRQGSAA
jgi:peptide/nickel transport system permease protein